MIQLADVYKDGENIIAFADKRGCDLLNFDSGIKVLVSKTDDTINGILLYKRRDISNRVVFDVVAIISMTRSISINLIDYMMELVENSADLLNQPFALFAPDEEIYEQCGFSKKEGYMLYSDGGIPCTIYLYQDSGPYTKTNPKIVDETVEAVSEHEARRDLFKKYSKDWYILKIKIRHQNDGAFV